LLMRTPPKALDKSVVAQICNLLEFAKTVASCDDFRELLERGSVSHSTMVGDRQWSLLKRSAVRHCCGSQSRAPVWLLLRRVALYRGIAFCGASEICLRSKDF